MKTNVCLPERLYLPLEMLDVRKQSVRALLLDFLMDVLPNSIQGTKSLYALECGLILSYIQKVSLDKQIVIVLAAGSGVEGPDPRGLSLGGDRENLEATSRFDGCRLSEL